MAFSINISVEAPIENQIQEITYDGTEIYQTLVFLSQFNKLFCNFALSDYMLLLIKFLLLNRTLKCLLELEI